MGIDMKKRTTAALTCGGLLTGAGLAIAVLGGPAQAADAMTDQVTHLKTTLGVLTDERDAARDDASQVTGQRDDLAADLRQARNKIDKLTRERDDLADSLAAQIDYDTDKIADLQAQLDDAPTPQTWHGFTVGEVIVCDPDTGAVPSTDVTADGVTWAACM